MSADGAIQGVFLCPGYGVRPGSSSRTDRQWLIHFMAQTYREDSVEREFPHLRQTVGQYLSPETPFWLVETAVPMDRDPNPVACLWLGNAVDQILGERHAHLLLLYVVPTHRRRGIGSALMLQAENWARQRGDRQISLEVFSDNELSLELYTRLGYQPQSLTLLKPIG
jgi:ribosomal protein S18 acetylase RimI-like enzyme